MTELERQVTNFLMNFGILPDKSNLNKTTELIYLINKHKPEQLTIDRVSGSAFTILNKGEIVENILFKTPEEARNYIKMKYPRRRFKEPKENVFVCTNYGTKFIIQEQHYR